VAAAAGIGARRSTRQARETLWTKLSLCVSTRRPHPAIYRYVQRTASPISHAQLLLVRNQRSARDPGSAGPQAQLDQDLVPRQQFSLSLVSATALCCLSAAPSPRISVVGSPAGCASPANDGQGPSAPSPSQKRVQSIVPRAAGEPRASRPAVSRPPFAQQRGAGAQCQPRKRLLARCVVDTPRCEQGRSLAAG